MRRVTADPRFGTLRLENCYAEIVWHQVRGTLQYTCWWVSTAAWRFTDGLLMVFSRSQILTSMSKSVSKIWGDVIRFGSKNHRIGLWNHCLRVQNGGQDATLGPKGVFCDQEGPRNVFFVNFGSRFGAFLMIFGVIFGVILDDFSGRRFLYENHWFFEKCCFT